MPDPCLVGLVIAAILITVGNYLDRENAAALGIFPGIAVEKIIPVGNAAAEGAGHCLVSLADLSRSDETAAAVQAVELSAHADFTDLWVRHMDFPKL